MPKLIISAAIATSDGAATVCGALALFGSTVYPMCEVWPWFRWKCTRSPVRST